MKTQSGQNYHKWGTSGKTLVLLHGWPGDSLKWQEAAQILQDKFTIYAADFAGWGETPLARVYTLEDYAHDVKQFLFDLKIEKPILVGHSFGGRVAIKLVSEDSTIIEKLILVASAGIERKGLKVQLFGFLSKIAPSFLKKVFHKFFSSKDYVALSGDKKQTFVNVVNEDLEDKIPKINIPTLLIWGDEDHTTPLPQGKLMEKLIPDAKLVIVPGANHGLPYRKAKEVAEAIEEYLINTN